MTEQISAISLNLQLWWSEAWAIRKILPTLDNRSADEYTSCRSENNDAPEEYPPERMTERRGHWLQALFIIAVGKVAGKVGCVNDQLSLFN